MDNIDRLLSFGLTRQEATLYLLLYSEGEISGYEAAKISGISRSNTYNALASLVEKGAAYIIEGSATRYIHVPIEEFCMNKIKSMELNMQGLVANMPTKKSYCDGYITISGENNIIDKMKNLLNAASERVYISLSGKLLYLVREELEKLIINNIKVVLITDESLDISGAKIYNTDEIGKQIRLIIDSKNVLTGEFAGADSSCLYSSKKNLVDIFKEALRNEIKLIEITKGVTK